MLNSCLVYFNTALKVESYIIHLEKYLIEVKKLNLLQYVLAQKWQLSFFILEIDYIFVCLWLIFDI